MAAATAIGAASVVGGAGETRPVGAAMVLVGAATYAWAFLVAGALWTVLRRKTPHLGAPLSLALRRVLLACGVLFVVGIWWGWPDGPWAPDEIDPAAVFGGVGQRFSDGWFDLYPPLHFYLLSLLYVPALLAGATGSVPPDGRTLQASLALLARALSLAMALGTLTAIAAFARAQFGARHEWIAALLAAVMLPFVYYAKTANVDVPYLFWVSLSLLWFRAAWQEEARAPVVWLAATAALAVGTKDQAFALYVLPAIALGWRLGRRPGGWRTLALGAGTGALVLAVVFNVFLNAAGFAEHLASITGGGSESYRMVPASLAGQWRLLQLTTTQLVWAVGWPGLALFGLAFASTRRGIHAPSWIWLFPVSYLVCFVGVVGYVYDRFLLPVLIVLAIGATPGLGRLMLDRRVRRVGAAMALALLALMSWRAASVNVLLLRDSRYAVEAWLTEHAGREARILAADRSGYMPRFTGFNYVEVPPTPDATVAADPEYIVVNVEFVHRFAPDSGVRRWVAWLESRDSPFDVAFRHKSGLGGTALAWWPAFGDREQDPFTNLDKANPEVVVFRRRADIYVGR